LHRLREADDGFTYPLTPRHRQRRSGAAITAAPLSYRRPAASGPRQLLRDGVDLPVARHALERVRASIVERDVRAGHQIFHGARTQHLASGCESAHARGDVHGDATDLALAQLDLPGVKSGADLDALTPQLVANAEGAADATGRAVECREYPVARGPMELAAVLLELRANHGVMCIEHGTPAPVSEFR